MSLREELIKYLWNGCTYESAELQANGVIERIEKRIDAIIEKLDSHDDKIKISALKQVKEMLK